MDSDSKSIFLSKTFWGIVLAALGHMGFFTWLAARAGTPVPADYNTLANSVVGGIGGILAIYGRLAALTPAHLLNPSVTPPSPLQSGMAHPGLLAWLGVVIATALLAGCGTGALAQQPVTQWPLAKFTHADLTTAATYATTNGYPARAAVYTALDVQLTACETALAAAAPKAPPAGGTVGAFTAFEVAAEAVGQGIPANVRMNCSAITLP